MREVAAELDQTILFVTVACENPDDTPCNGPGFPAGSLGNADPGDSVVVTLDYKYSLITPLPGFIDADNKIDLQSVTEMRVE